MASRTKNLKTEKNATGNEKYLNDIFTMMKNMDNLTVADQKTRFNSTEIRLLGEILASRYVGKRLISTQLAQLLGITRSAVSQIVNRLESDGIVKRVADDVDRKIAYVELSEKSMGAYKALIQGYTDFVGRVVAYMGVSKMDKMLALVDDFYAAVENACAECHAEEKDAK